MNLKRPDQQLEIQDISRQRPPLKIDYQDDKWQLVIRPMEASDAPMLQKAIASSLPELQRYMEWAHRSLYLDQQRSRLVKTRSDYFTGKDYQMGVFEAKTGEFLMGTGWSVPGIRNPAALEIGYWTVTQHTGKGLATLVTQILAVVAFECFACDRIEVLVNVENVASQRVLAKCGFHHEGTLRNGNMAPSAELLRNNFCLNRAIMLYSFLPGDRMKSSWYEPVCSRVTLTANAKKKHV